MRKHFARQAKVRVRALAALFDDQTAEREHLWRDLRSEAASVLTRLRLGSELRRLHPSSQSHALVRIVATP
eukprot:scaffold2862_cov272-Pinguiococcus_pyrenoidosus.AAC.6